jgi:peptidoglycan-associated lipoprotein
MVRGLMVNKGFGRLGNVAAFALVAAMAAGCSTSTGEGVDGMDGSTITDETGSLGEFERTGNVGSGGPFQDVYFAFDSDDLDGAARQAVATNANWLQQNPGVRAEIEGHCDERGTSEYNLALGARRAKAVRDALIGQGISAGRLSTVSYGEELPVCKDKNESCWARNRRGHLVDLTK